MNKHFEKGIAHFKANEFELAAKTLEKSIKLNGDHASSQYFCGMAYFKLEKLAEAKNYLDKAILLDADNVEFIHSRGVVKLCIGKHADPLPDFDKSVVLEPENPYRYSSRAFARDQMGDLDGAIEDYQHAIALDPEDEVAKNNFELLGYKVTQRRQNQVISDFKSSIGKFEDKESKMSTSGIKVTPQDPTDDLTYESTWDVVKGVVTTKKGFNEFLNYWFRKKNMQS